MAIKLHCTNCDKFIKEIRKQDLSDFVEGAICSSCKGKIEDTEKKITKIFNTYSHQIKLQYDRARADIENLMRKIVEGEKEEDAENP